MNPSWNTPNISVSKRSQLSFKNLPSIRRVKDQSNLPPGDRAVTSSCSGRFGGGSGRWTPRYCRSMDLFGSKELNFNPTRKLTKMSRRDKNIYTTLLCKNLLHHWDVCVLVWTHPPAAQDGWPVCVWELWGPATGWPPSGLSSPHQSLESPPLKRHRNVFKGSGTSHLIQC